MLLVPLLALAQEKCTDIICPTGMRSQINDCCIYDIKDGNVVYFVKEGDSSLIEARWIIKDGVDILFVRELVGHSSSTV